jgi:hypothetical protein
MAANATVTYSFVQGTPANAPDVNANFADVLTWINTNAAHLDGTKAFTGAVTLPSAAPTNANHATRKAYVDGLIESPVLRLARERWTVVSAAPTGTVNFDAATSALAYYTTNTSADWKINIRGSSTVTLNSLLAVGDSATVAFAAVNGSTAYYPDEVQVDGVAVTPKWLGSVPGGGQPNAIDVYTFVVVKTAATPTYVVLGSQASFV